MNESGLKLLSAWHYGCQRSLPLKRLSPFIPFSLHCCPPPSLPRPCSGRASRSTAGQAGSPARRGRRSDRPPGRCWPHKPADRSWRKLSRYACQAPRPNDSWPPSQQGAVQAFPPPDGCRVECPGVADPGIAHLPGEGHPGLVGAARRAG